MKESGRVSLGEAGWACGVRSGESGGFLVAGELDEGGGSGLGGERLPRKWMRGVRWCSAARRIRVGFMAA